MDLFSSLIQSEKPDIKWTDVAGLTEAKENIDQVIIMPNMTPQVSQENKIPYHSILLYGPPGTGKTLLAKATATHNNNFSFFSVSSCDIVSICNSESHSEETLRFIFDKARSEAPAIIFIDDIDILFTDLSEKKSEFTKHTKAEFINQMDRVLKSNDAIFIITATNKPWNLDSDIIKLFDKKAFISLPDFDARKEIIGQQIKGNTPALTAQEINELSHMTAGFSGADIIILIRQASMCSIKSIMNSQYFFMHLDQLWPCSSDHPEAIKLTVDEMTEEQRNIIAPAPIEYTNLIDSLIEVKPSISKDELDRFDKWKREFGTK